MKTFHILFITYYCVNSFEVIQRKKVSPFPFETAAINRLETANKNLGTCELAQDAIFTRLPNPYN